MLLTVKTDCHTHTIMSGHAYSTLEENLNAARTAGLEVLATTEHGPAMQGAPDPIYFRNMNALPRIWRGVTLLRGVEANIMDYHGALDMPGSVLKRLDFCLASYHEICLPPAQAKEHTAGWLAVLTNPYIDCLGHPGRGSSYPFDIERVVAACRDAGKAMEINQHTLDMSEDWSSCRDIALACKEAGTAVLVNSDAHFSTAVGQVELGLELLASLDFPESLIINRDRHSLLTFLKNRKPWLRDL